ncbi:MAG: DNA helicase RecQ [Pseudomonadales bacterium]
MNRAQELLTHTWGYQAFRGPQAEIIEHTLAGGDSLVLMPTGGGKSLCYQIPAIVGEGMGVIVSPLIALMQDQVEALELLGVSAAYLNSSLSSSQQSAVMNAASTGKLQMLYIAPERLIQNSTLNWLSQLKLSLIAIDEAHCVSQWGHDFRSDYLSLHVLADIFPSVPRIALTATADDRTRDEIIDRLQLSKPRRFVSSFDRPNIRYTVQAKIDAKRQLLQFLQDHREEAGIIYCMSRKKVESTAEWLCGRGFTAIPYHAGLNAETRSHNQQRFLREEHVIVVATIAFGMGIDKPDVRFVAHMDLPKSIEAYYQETGRAGRDGEHADAWMVYGLQDVVRLRQMTEESSAAEEHKRSERHKLDGLLGWCEITNCRRGALLEYFGDQQEQACGNCDTCLNPPETWDATQAAQKLLSCVYRTGQRFGAGHVIDVLRGKQSNKVTQFNHAELSTFGIGEDLDDQQWRSIIRQLLVQGYLHNQVDRYGALVLTEQSRALLRGEIQLSLRRELKLKPERKTKPAKRAVAEHRQELWDALRECRKRLSEEHGVPPYVIFHDATLMEMMEYMPNGPVQLLALNGVGDAKLERYGDEFLAVIRQFA